MSVAPLRLHDWLMSDRPASRRQAALGRAYEAASRDKVSTLINVQSSREFLSTQAFPPGTPRNLEPGVTAYMH